MSAPHAPFLRRATVVAGVFALTAGTIGTSAAANPPTPAAAQVLDLGQAWDDGETSASDGVIVTFKPGTTKAAKAQAAAVLGLVDGDGLSGLDATVYHRDAAAPSIRYRSLPQVLSITPNMRLYRDADPSGEQLWGLLWGLHNTGQSVNGSSGSANIDIDALEADAITTGDPATIVAVIDDGVDFSHPDLAARAWTNPGESGPDGSGGDLATNGVDDDGNGYIDDVHGWDFCNDDNTVHDVNEDYHGTHVAGTIAASLDGQGVVGVAPNVSIMALKFLDNSEGCGLTSMAIDAIAYAKSFGVVLSNNSWGGRGAEEDFASLKEAIRVSGLLFVTSAGNDGIDNDSDPDPAYPASFDLPNVVTVAATDRDGGLAAFSNYGHISVDLVAPGVDIASAYPAGDITNGEPAWAYLEGTSMAAPHVTGVAALIAAQDPTLLELANLATLKARLLASGKPLPLTVGDTVSGRMVDARFALDAVAPTALAPNTQVLTVGSTAGTTSVSAAIGWPAATDDPSGAGVAGYDLDQQVNGGAWTRLYTGTTARSATRILTTDAVYRFRVRAHDRGGNLSPFMEGATITPRRYQETMSIATYGGTWSASTSSSASGGKTKFASRAGASVSFRFTGRSVALVAPKGPTRGSARVYVDDVYKGIVSETRSSGASRIVLYGATWATNGTHTIKFVVVGTSGHPRFDVDALVVLR